MKLISAVLIVYLIQPAQIFGQSLKISKTGQGIEISEGEKKVLFYQKEPKSLDGKYERAGYIHPLYNLKGEVITEDFPKDHLHHHGIFWAWHQMVYNGKSIGDSWTSENVKWEVKKLKPNKGKDFVSLKSEVFWKSKLEKEQWEPVIRENTDITIYKATDEHRIVDFTIQLKAMVDNLEIGGSNDVKGYGGFSLRFKDPKGIDFISRGNKVTAQNPAVTAGPWMDFLGTFGTGERSGVAVFNHPSNPGDINSWILRNETSMQNPVFPGRETYKLSSDGITLRYRLVIHSGSIGHDRLEAMYKEYALNSRLTKGH